MRLSVVVPVYNESAHLESTMEALAVAVADAGFEHVDVVLVDDGSTDGSASVAEQALAGRLPLRVVAQPNRGRFEARRAGLARATGDWVLLLDGRVRLRPGSLAFVRTRLERGDQVWNGHVHVHTGGNPYAAFGDLLVRLAWRGYFDEPRTTSFGAEDFDHYPKGTGCFLAPRQLLLAAVDAFESRYDDLRLANDDTPLIRWIANREQIHLSPAFACDYTARADLHSFVRHGYHRGTTFLDGHGRRGTRFFPAVVAFYPVSGGIVWSVIRKPALAPALGVACGVLASAVAAQASRSRFETLAFGALCPLYVLAHGAGMWRGLALAARNRVGRAS